MSNRPKSRQLTLDLDATRTKRSRVSNNEVLTSPDVQMLKLSSPQLEAFLARDSLAETESRWPGYTFPTTITEQQELYVKEFDDALKKKHAEAAAASIVTIDKATSAFKQQQQLMCGGGGVVSTSDTTDGNIATVVAGVSPLPAASEALAIKQEPGEDVDESIPSPPKKRGKVTRTRSRKSATSSSYQDGDDAKIAPVDMVAQERIKLERKRLRNRLAAHKCRERKLEKISSLDEKVRDLKDENTQLSQVLKKLKDSVCNLKQEVMEHVNSGCQINI